MRARKLVAAAAIGTTVALVAGVGAIGAGGHEGRGDGRYIVVLKDDADAVSVASDHARDDEADVSDVYRHAFRGYAAHLSERGLEKVLRDDRVAFVSPDYEVSADGASQAAPTGVRRIGASSNAKTQTLTAKGTGVGVAVLDTGIQPNHPDLAGVVSGRNCVGGTSTSDDNGHGTHVAGTIAARENTQGVVGVAPEATLYAVKVLDRSGNGTWSQIICGIDWVTANAATIKVANMSLGGAATVSPSNADCTNSSNDALHTAICRSVKAGVTYVVSAGNNSTDASRYAPAGYDEVIAVSALSDSNGAGGSPASAPTCTSGQTDESIASFSNYGAAVDIAAPGVCILSTWTGGKYATLSGTSMAAPHVSGAAALWIQGHPGAAPADVRTALQAAAEPSPAAGDRDAYREGIVHLP